jgi:putative MATE family efflux protein
VGRGVGRAIGTAIAQGGMGVAFALLLRRAAGGRFARLDVRVLRPLFSVGGLLVLRVTALLGAFAGASAVAARSGPDTLAAHQVLIGLFFFLALALDALAIAAQVVVARALGAADVAGARGAARRVVALSLGFGVVLGVVLVVLRGPLPRLFTREPEVLAAADTAWLLFAALIPPGAVVFALDGVLIGAADARAALTSTAVGALVFAPVAVVVHARGGGLRGVWLALSALILGRLLTLLVRYRRGSWTGSGRDRN